MVVDTSHMCPSELLAEAERFVPDGLTTTNGTTAATAREFRHCHEWELALDVLVELGDCEQLPWRFWELLTHAAEQMQLGRDASWCRWRGGETRHGVIRAELQLLAPAHGGRRTALPGDGVLRPMWDIGRRTPAGEPALHIAAVWVESTPALEPGGRATIRLMPLSSEHWQQLVPGDVIRMYETRSPGGSATVIEVQPPVPGEPG